MRIEVGNKMMKQKNGILKIGVCKVGFSLELYSLSTRCPQMEEFCS